MRRREFITLLGSASAAWPLIARARQRTMPIVAFIHAASLDGFERYVDAFRQGLEENGFVESKNVAIEYRSAEGHYERLPTIVADMVHRQVSVIVGNLQSALVAKAATGTIPIVFGVASDPVEAGLVASLSRPGGNLTGVTNFGTKVGPKRLELLHQIVPTASKFAMLINPTNRNVDALLKDHFAAANYLRLDLHVLHAVTESDLDRAFDAFDDLHAQALIIGPDPFLQSE